MTKRSSGVRSGALVQQLLRPLIVGLLVAAPVVNYLSHAASEFLVVNADTLAAPAVIETVRNEGFGALAAWYWPPAPYFLDILAYIPIWLALPNPWLAPAVFMVYQLLLAFAAIRFLCGSLASTDSADARWTPVLSFAAVMAFVIAGITPVRLLAISSFRGGSAILALFAVGAAIRWMVAGRPSLGPARTFGISLSTFLVVLSDPLFVAAVIAPLLVIVNLADIKPLLRSRRIGDLRALVPSVAVSVSIVIALAANARLQSDAARYGPKLGGAQLRTQAKYLYETATELDAWLVAASLAGLIATVLLWRQLRRDGSRRAWPFLLLLQFWAASAVFHVLANLINSQETAPRYFQVLALIPLVLLGPLAAELFHRSAPRRTYIATPVVAVMAAVLLAGPALLRIPEIDGDWKPAEVECIDSVLPDANADRGVSGYWEARTVFLFSDVERTVAPLDALGNPWRVNASSDWFDQPYDFALFGTSQFLFDPPARFARGYAPNLSATPCGNFLVLTAGEGGLDIHRLDILGAELRFDGCMLDTFIGEPTVANCEMAVPVSPEPSFGSYGAYAPLSPGDYEILVQYRSAAPAETILGELQVTRLTSVAAHAEIIHSEPFLGADGERWVVIPLTVPDNGGSSTTEVRTFTNGSEPYDVLSVIYRRVG